MSFFDNDADIEQAELEALGSEADAMLRTMARLRAAGDLTGAAAACTHGWGYPLNSIAATNADDPRAGQDGHRCLHCGSVLRDSPFDHMYPCEVPVIFPCDWIPNA
jgi:hypothetical protein